MLFVLLSSRPAELAEHVLLVAGRVVERALEVAHHLRVADGGQRLRRRRAGRALGRDEERVVGLVPGAPVAQLDPDLLAERGHVGDELAVGAHRRRLRRARARLRAGALAARGRARGPVGRAGDDRQHLPAALVLLLARRERGQLVLDARPARARRRAAQAAVVGVREVGGLVRIGLERGPVQHEPVERRLELAHVVLPADELGRDALARAGGPEEVRVLLGDPDREIAAGLALGDGRRARLGRRRGGRGRGRGRLGGVLLAAVVTAARQDRDRESGRDERLQTAETSSSSATRKEEPQPQAAITLGFSTLKPAPCRPST